jgi:hypothetical protein
VCPEAFPPIVNTEELIDSEAVIEVIESPIEETDAP